MNLKLKVINFFQFKMKNPLGCGVELCASDLNLDHLGPCYLQVWAQMKTPPADKNRNNSQLYMEDTSDGDSPQDR